MLLLNAKRQRSKGTGKEINELISSSNNYDTAKINFHQIYLKDIMIDNMAALGGHYKHLTLFTRENQKKLLHQNLQAIL